MEHIENMNRSLMAVVDLVRIQVANEFSINRIYYNAEYDFLNVSDYIVQVKEYLLKHDGTYFRGLVFPHLAAADFIVNTLRSNVCYDTDVDMFTTLKTDPHGAFNDVIFWYDDADGDRCFANTDIILRATPDTADMRGDKVIDISGWGFDRDKDRELSRKVTSSTYEIEFCEIVDQVMWVYSELAPFFPGESPIDEVPEETTKLSATECIWLYYYMHGTFPTSEQEIKNAMSEFGYRGKIGSFRKAVGSCYNRRDIVLVQSRGKDTKTARFNKVIACLAERGLPTEKARADMEEYRRNLGN